MPWDLCTVTVQKARKEYDCEAATWLDNINMDDYDFSVEELAIIEKAKSEKWKILKNTQYTKTQGKWEGEFTVFRARLDLDKICRDHEIYPE